MTKMRWLKGCHTHSTTPATSRVGNRQPHLPNVERNRPRICRPEQPGSRIPRPPPTPSPQHQIYTLPCQTNFNRAVTAIVATNFEECCKTTVAVATMPTKQQQLQTTHAFEHTKLTRSAWFQGVMVRTIESCQRPLAAHGCHNGHPEQPCAVTGRWHKQNMSNMKPWCHGGRHCDSQRRLWTPPTN